MPFNSFIQFLRCSYGGLDQREMHRQIFECDETIDYDLMDQNPDAATNRWLCEAFENKTPIIYILSIASAASTLPQATKLLHYGNRREGPKPDSCSATKAGRLFAARER